MFQTVLEQTSPVLRGWGGGGGNFRLFFFFFFYGINLELYYRYNFSEVGLCESASQTQETTVVNQTLGTFLVAVQNKWRQSIKK